MFAKNLFISALFVLLLQAINISAQTESCSLQVKAYRNDDTTVVGVVITATRVETKKVYKSVPQRGGSFFAKLIEGEYQLAATKAGYKKSVMSYFLTCFPNENGVVKTSIPLWTGNTKETITVDDEIQLNPPENAVEGDVKKEAVSEPASEKNAEFYKLAPGGVLGILNEKATNLVKPPYPAAARAVRASGAVNVQVTIDEEGTVISASAVSGHPLLRAAAVKAARESKFVPTLFEGKPVKVTGIIVYNFVP